MTVASRLVESALHLPPAVTRDVQLTRDLDVRTRDGIVLKTDHYAPRLAAAPTVMIRTPYGRRGLVGVVTGRVLAERGFHVVLQSCRGTFGSGGTFAPFRHERADGLDTIAWIEAQPWYEEGLFTAGPSYVGFTQWAVADSPAIKGMLTAVTTSSFQDATYAGGSFSLDTVLNWAALVRNQSLGNDRGGSLVSFAIRQMHGRPRLRQAFAHLPLSDVDTIATGEPISFYQEWLLHGPQSIQTASDPYWQERSHHQRVASVAAAVCMVGGWYDIFLPWQLVDYARLRAAGAHPRLVIGPWSHASRDLLSRSIAEGVTWFQKTKSGVPHGSVDLYVGGADEWRSYDEWPPPGRPQDWHLGFDRSLHSSPGVGLEGSDQFRYDPDDPTPSPGGPLLTENSGQTDNSSVEMRSDLLVYSSDVLTNDVEAIGPVSAEIRMRSSSAYFDLFVRICDVDGDGRSVNVCDGLTRVSRPGDAVDEIRAVAVSLWPTAYRWRAGHRIRVQIAGGAHPRYARNPGTGAPLGEAVTLVAVEHEVFLNGSVIRLWQSD